MLFACSLKSLEVIGKYHLPLSSWKDKWHVNNLIFDNFLVNWQEYTYFFGFCVVCIKAIIHLSGG